MCPAKSRFMSQAGMGLNGTEKLMNYQGIIGASQPLRAACIRCLYLAEQGVIRVGETPCNRIHCLILQIHARTVVSLGQARFVHLQQGVPCGEGASSGYVAIAQESGR